MPHVAVNSRSRISSARWVEILKRNPNVPDFIKHRLRSMGRMIEGPSKFQQPAGTIPKEWVQDLGAAFAAETWEITTAHEMFEIAGRGMQAKVRRHVEPDLGQGEYGPGYWLTDGPGRRTWSEDTSTLFGVYNVGQIGVMFGQTFSSAAVAGQEGTEIPTRQAHLNSGRALIMIVDRITVRAVGRFQWSVDHFEPEVFSAVKQQEVRMDEDSLACTFLHELACHGGRMNQGKPDTSDGDTSVGLVAEEINAMFGNPTSAVMNRVAEAVQTIAEARAVAATRRR